MPTQTLKSNLKLRPWHQVLAQPCFSPIVARRQVQQAQVIRQALVELE
jgi:hypothetical protein